MFSETIQYILGIIGLLLIIPGQFYYIRGIIRYEVKPHLYTSLIFFIVIGIGFLIQIKNGGGIGSWITGLTAILQLFHFLLALKYEYSPITKSDTVILFLALTCIPIYIYAENPYIALILIVTIDILAFIPTFRKTILEPFSENLTSGNLGNLKSFLSILALGNINILTILYPLIMLLVSVIFVLLIIYLRIKQTKI